MAAVFGSTENFERKSFRGMNCYIPRQVQQKPTMVIEDITNEKEENALLSAESKSEHNPNNSLSSTSSDPLKPRIALYISGNLDPKIFAFTKKSLIDFTKQYDVDLFVSIFTISDDETKLSIESKTENGTTLAKAIEWSWDQHVELFNDFSLKGINVDSKNVKYPFLYENRMVIDNRPETVTETQEELWGKWRKLYQCNEMRKEFEKNSGSDYKFIIRADPCVAVLEGVLFDKIPSLNGIILGFGRTLGYPDDLFAIGSTTAMNHYCNIDKIFEKFNDNGEMKDCDNHIFTKMTLEKYPVTYHVQIGLVSNAQNEEPHKNIKQISSSGENYFLSYYDKTKFVRN